ncbi:MAG TPA: methyl-accepting chemotaxis protein [Terriglobales bacterium]|nr:methyl-accepting chemotaxis protein [Terriglobales bacterium]
MRNLSLRVKLGAAFGTVLLIFALLGVFNYFTVAKLDDVFSEAQERDLKVEKSCHIEIGVEKQMAAVRGFLLSGREDVLVRREEGQKEYQDAMTFLQNTVRTDQGKELLSEVAGHYDAFRIITERQVEARRNGNAKDAEAIAFAGDSTARREDLRRAIRDFAEYQVKKREGAGKEQDALVASANRQLIVIPVIGIVLGAVAAGWLSRLLSRTVENMSSSLREIAHNNLAIADVKVHSRDEIGLAGMALNEMKNNLRGLIESIAKTAEHVASASEELSASASQQAQSAETQKDQTMQAATAMQEMVATVSQVSENSGRAAEAARQAAETARRGGGIVDGTLAKMRSIAGGVRDTAKKMEELDKASDQIGHIVGVIDDIADQTNLLALNAAIEAARAGEQGRGFAVVADEVRKLAERTTGATKEIAHMIKNIQGETRLAVKAMEMETQQVEEGLKSTTQAGDSLKEIIQMAEQVGEMVTSIATAATEQSSASEQVNLNMDQIARLVRESAVGSQESAKACQELSALALDLQKMVGKFCVDEGKARSASTASSPEPQSEAGERERARAMSAS